MALFYLALSPLLSVGSASLDAAGDYLVGVSLIGIGLYFWFHAHKFLVKKKDGSFEVRQCCACTHYDASTTDAGKGEEEEDKPLLPDGTAHPPAPCCRQASDNSQNDA